MNVRDIKCSASGGLAGGVVFGAMMALMGMLLPMIGKIAAHPSAVTKLFVLLVLAALVGASFVTFFNLFAPSTSSKFGYSLVYGGVWWFVGPLTLMPLMMGRGVNWNATAVPQIMYGAILGLSYVWLRSRTTARQPGAATESAPLKDATHISPRGEGILPRLNLQRKNHLPRKLSSCLGNPAQ